MDQINLRVKTIVLADHHAIVREGIAAFCGTRPDLKIIGQCSTAAETLETVTSAGPDFVVMELNLEGMTGSALICKLRESAPKTRILILSTSRDAVTIREVFRLGVDGYLLKDGPARHLLDAINYVNDGGQYVTPLIRREALEGGTSGVLESLSPRELQVFSGLVDGMRPKDIAAILRLSSKTVDTYRAALMRKLGVESVAGLVRFAIERNLQSSLPKCRQMGQT